MKIYTIYTNTIFYFCSTKIKHLRQRFSAFMSFLLAGMWKFYVPACMCVLCCSCYLIKWTTILCDCGKILHCDERRKKTGGRPAASATVQTSKPMRLYIQNLHWLLIVNMRNKVCKWHLSSYFYYDSSAHCGLMCGVMRLADVHTFTFVPISNVCHQICECV